MYRNVYEGLAARIKPSPPPRHLRGQAQGRAAIPVQRGAQELLLDGERR
jgi:hypothetical protein